MSLIKHVEGDILQLFAQGTRPVILHQANCFHTMGSGIAKTLADKYPEVLDADCKTLKGDKAKLGRFSVAAITKHGDAPRRLIFNIYSQYAFGWNKCHTDYEAITSGFKLAATHLQREGIGKETVLAVPYKYGSNRGGGDWNLVMEAIINGLSESPFLVEAIVLPSLVREARSAGFMA